MKAQMRFQKIICLIMIIVGALAVVYALVYCTGSVQMLSDALNSSGKSFFKAAKGLNDATYYTKIKSFNDLLLIFGIVIILLGVVLYIAACNKRRNYYITNYVAIGLCAGGDIILSLVAIILNGYWLGEFKKIDFESWHALAVSQNPALPYSESTVWFDLGFVVYAIVIIAAVFLILNLVWKIKLMKGEKALLAGNQNGTAAPETIGGGAA